jgi:hypothetical protein
MSEFEILNFRAFQRSLEQEGYKAYYPTDSIAIVDVEVAESEDCPQCEADMKYVGFRFEASYRCFAVCFECNIGIEF